MDDRQQAGASQPSVPQDAPSQTGKLNHMQQVPADGAGKREPVQEAPSPSEARAILERLPMISSESDGETSQRASQGRETTLDQIFASEKEALKQESKFEKKAQRQEVSAPSQAYETQEGQTGDAKAVEQPPENPEKQASDLRTDQDSQEKTSDRAAEESKAAEETASDQSKTPAAP